MKLTNLMAAIQLTAELISQFDGKGPSHAKSVPALKKQTNRDPDTQDLQDRIGRLSDLLIDPEIQKIIRSNPSKFPMNPLPVRVAKKDREAPRSAEKL
jgi:hypothetical protein